MDITNGDIPHVGPGTPGGNWLRRYWLAVGAARELYDIPQAVRVLGEDLVLFRDLEGRPGLLGRACAHRGASLEYGDIEARGIRCVEQRRQPRQQAATTIPHSTRTLSGRIKLLSGRRQWLLVADLLPLGILHSSLHPPQRMEQSNNNTRQQKTLSSQTTKV